MFCIDKNKQKAFYLFNTNEFLILETIAFTNMVKLIVIFC